MRPSKPDLVNIRLWNEMILRQGRYFSADGTPVTFISWQQEAEKNTLVFSGDWLVPHALKKPPWVKDHAGQIVRVVNATTGTAAQLANAMAAGGEVTLLNFASARKPGGGYLRGSRAQEEDLCRCSGLYPCLAKNPEFYKVAGGDSALYTDHMVWSPQVPFFRDDIYALLEGVFTANVITAAAPNATAYLQSPGYDPSLDTLEVTLSFRASLVLALAEYYRTEVLILGAWGCGVFGNDPEMVASVFSRLLESPRFKSSFREVIFAIPGHLGIDASQNLSAFQAEFAE